MIVPAILKPLLKWEHDGLTPLRIHGLALITHANTFGGKSIKSNPFLVELRVSFPISHVIFNWLRDVLLIHAAMSYASRPTADAGAIYSRKLTSQPTSLRLELYILIGLHNLYSSPSTIRMTKSRRSRWEGNVPCMGRWLRIAFWWESEKECKESYMKMGR
jgi:hypothetical protein